MGKLSFHIQHYKATQLNGIDRHNRRLGEIHSNTEIKNELSKDNVTLISVNESLYKDAKKRIDEEVIQKGGRVTKASIWVTEAILTLPQGIEKERANEFFMYVIQFFGAKSGTDNIVSAVVHYDETTPHMHLDFLNITREGKLSRKQIWTKTALCKIHDELPRYLQQRGFEVTRGDRLDDFADKQKAGMSIKKYKVYKEKEKVKEEYKDLVKEYNVLIGKYNKVVDIYTSLSNNCIKTAYNIIQKTQQEHEI